MIPDHTNITNTKELLEELVAHEKVRHGGTVVDLAVLKAVGVHREEKRETLGVSQKLKSIGGTF